MADAQPKCVGCWLVDASSGYFFMKDASSGLLQFNVLPQGLALICDNLSNQDLQVFAFPASAGFNISVVVDIPPSLNWSSCTIQPKNGNVPAGVELTYVRSDHQYEDTAGNHRVDFKVLVQRAGSRGAATGTITPWSVKQQILFELLPGNGAAALDISGPVYIEAYGIYEQQPAFFKKDGIPLDLLRLFLPTSLTTGISTEKQWIEWVARVCHGTQDPAAAPGTLRKDSTQHWLRYQVWNGAFSFIGEYGHDFHLDAWLDAYSSFKDNRSWLTTVNCFDQAGIVETVLSLGMDNARLRWEVKKPFGYIKADLVGWGMTNNPFFEADMSLIMLNDPMDERRTPFRSHVFISISPTATYAGDNAVVVDACAGPITGDRTYAEYLTTCALQDGNPLLLTGTSTVKEHLAGVDGSDKAGDAGTLSELLHDRYKGIPEDIGSALGEIASDFSGEAVPDTFNSSAVIHAILDPILANQDTAQGIVLDQQIKKDIPTVTDNTAASVTNEVRAIGVVRNYKDKDPTYISMRLSVFAVGAGGVESAVAALRSRLNLLALPMDWQAENKINIKENPADITDKRIRVFGNVHLSLFIYKNVLAAISGNAVMEYIPSWTSKMVAELEKY
ncbi:hypothetical protein SBRCBS47491_009678 [Sporothrix bragantina]|uniref:Uncharacterized protein n=1 Tax=Sporothrix bragantina TaxID=671064 RepID=A0ABP0CWP8_9PEZI